MKNIEIIALEIVEGCNLYCSFCARNASNSQLRFIDINKYNEFLDRLDDIKEKPSIAFTGGEPLLHPDIIDIVNNTIDRGYKFSITTNGTIQNENLFKICKRSNLFKHFIVSLDSYNQEIHNRIRGLNTAYIDTLNFIERINDLDISFAINMTVDKENYLDIDKTIKLSKEIGAKDISIASVKPSGRGEALLSLKELEDIAFQIKGNQDMIDEKFKVYATEITFFLYDMKNYITAFLDGEKWSCAFGDSSLHIKMNGDIQGCATCDYILGNIFIQNFNINNFWEKNETLSKVRNKANLSGFCKKCKYVEFCGGCRCRAYALTGDLLGDDLYCPLIIEGPSYEKYV